MDPGPHGTRALGRVREGSGFQEAQDYDCLDCHSCGGHHDHSGSRIPTLGPRYSRMAAYLESALLAVRAVFRLVDSVNGSHREYFWIRAVSAWLLTRYESIFRLSSN